MEDKEWDEWIAVKQKILELHSQFCKTFSNPKRLEILCLLREGELSVADLTEKLNIQKANVSQHLKLMRMMKIVKTRREGTMIYYSILNQKLADACGHMQEVLRQLMEGSHSLEKEIVTSMKGEITP